MRASRLNHGLQAPLPFAFARRDEFLGLPPEGRTAHLWEAYRFCQESLGGGRFADEELERNLQVLRRMMLKIAKAVAKRLSEDGSWKDSSDARWPRNHKGDDIDHWYDSGAYPPQFLALPEDPTAWRAVLAEQPEALFDEMIAWVETPAGQAGVGDEDLQKLLADRETYLPEARKSASEGPEPAKWENSEVDRQDGLQWLAARSADGELRSWATTLELAGVLTFLGGISSNRRPIDRLLPELMSLEASGELALLQRHLDEASAGDGTRLAKLRRCLPKGR